MVELRLMFGGIEKRVVLGEVSPEKIEAVLHEAVELLANEYRAAAAAESSSALAQAG